MHAVILRIIIKECANLTPTLFLVVIIDQMWVRDVVAHGRGRDVAHFHLQVLLRLLLLLASHVVLVLAVDEVVLMGYDGGGDGDGCLHGSLMHLGPVQRHAQPQVEVVRVVMGLLLTVAVARAAAAAVVDLGRLSLGVFLVLHAPVLEPYLDLGGEERGQA